MRIQTPKSSYLSPELAKSNRGMRECIQEQGVVLKVGLSQTSEYFSAELP